AETPLRPAFGPDVTRNEIASTTATPPTVSFATTVAVVPTSAFCDVGATVTAPPTTAAAGSAPMTLAATTSGVASRAARATNRTCHRVLVRMDPSQDHSGGESATVRVPTGVKDVGDPGGVAFVGLVVIR